MDTPSLGRRSFLNAALLPAAAGLATPALLHAPTPVVRSGEPGLKMSLNAFSFNDALTAGLAGGPGGVSLFDVLDFCAQNDFEAIDATAYYFPGYPEVPPREFINEFKRRAFQLGLDISGTGIRNDFAQTDTAKRAADVKRGQAMDRGRRRNGRARPACLRRVRATEGTRSRWDEAAAWMSDALAQCAAHGGEVWRDRRRAEPRRHAALRRRVLKLLECREFRTGSA